MSESSPDRDLISRAEEMILGIGDVRSCRIAIGEDGSISEVHIVAGTERQPGMVARDAESILNAELGLSVDSGRIGVVVVDISPGEPGGRTPWFDYSDDLVEERLSERPQQEGAEEATEGPSLEFLEDSTRTGFLGLSLDIGGPKVAAEVRLGRNGIEVTGRFEGTAASGGVRAVVAEAAVRALAELLDEDFHLCLSGISEIDIAGREAVAAVVEVVDGREARSYSGCAFKGRDASEAAVLAVLDAVNRPLGRWKTRREVHYRIS